MDTKNCPNLRTMGGTAVHAPGLLMDEQGYSQGTMCNPKGRVRGGDAIWHGTSATVTCRRCLKALAS